MIELSLNETRVLGVLFEKEQTTPDQCPLSLNALTNGCNQKSNREPVLSLTEADVQETLDSLQGMRLVTEVVVGSRVRKYRQRFGNTEFSEFRLSLKEQSILSVLFLRGPQTPGELRTRTNRLCEFSDVTEVEHALEELVRREGGACIAKLPREAGKRESRYIHLFSGDAPPESSESEVELSSSAGRECSNACHEKYVALEQKLALMQAQIDTLQSAWDALNE